MRMVSLLAACFAVGMTLIVHGATRNVDFSNDAVGQPPKGFEFGLTAKAGAPGKWVVQAEGDNKYLAQVDADVRDRGFRSPSWRTSRQQTSTCLPASSRYRAASIRRQASSGGSRTRTTTTSFEQTRSKTTSSYIRWRKASARICPLKGEGRTCGKKAQVPSGQWSTLRVVAAGPRFEVFFNGNKLCG